MIMIASVKAKNESTLTVAWRVTFSGNLDLDFCTVEYQQEDDGGQPVGDWIVATTDAIGENLMYDVSGLIPYTLYSIRLTCNNLVGPSNNVTADPERTGQFCKFSKVFL